MIGRLAPPWDRLLLDARLATLRDDLGAYGVIESAALAWKDGLVAFAGPASELPGEAATLAARVESAEGRWITPGLVDCHTHLVFAGDRAQEFERRLQGASYEQIAREGGGGQHHNRPFPTRRQNMHLPRLHPMRLIAAAALTCVAALPAGAQRVLWVVAQLAAAVVALWLAWLGWGLVGLEREAPVPFVAGIPSWVPMLALPVGFGLMGLRFLVAAALPPPVHAVMGEGSP
mgnify:CR=1 FL=1